MEVMTVAKRQGWKGSIKTRNLTKVSLHCMSRVPGSKFEGPAQSHLSPAASFTLLSSPCVGNYLENFGELY